MLPKNAVVFWMPYPTPDDLELIHIVSASTGTAIVVLALALFVFALVDAEPRVVQLDHRPAPPLRNSTAWGNPVETTGTPAVTEGQPERRRRHLGGYVRGHRWHVLRLFIIGALVAFSATRATAWMMRSLSGTQRAAAAQMSPRSIRELSSDHP